MLNNQNSLLDEQLLGVVIDQLPVDEDVGLVGSDLVDFFTHLLSLGFGDLLHFLQRFDSDSRAVDLDLVVVHRGVADEHAAVFQGSLAADGDVLFQDESFAEEGVFDAAPKFLNNLDIGQVGRALQSHNGVDG